MQVLCDCDNVLRDDGTSYGDYVEQLTHLLFLKMADERSRRPTARLASSRLTTPGPRCSRAAAMSCSTTTATRSKLRRTVLARAFALPEETGQYDFTEASYG